MTDTEINEAVAIKLGWTVYNDTEFGMMIGPKTQKGDICGGIHYKLPNYSGDIRMAWDVLDKL